MPIAIHLTHDRPAIAARLARTGAGRILSPRSAAAAQLRRDVEWVFKSSFRSTALSHKESIQRASGVERAADIVEVHFAKCTSAS